MYWENGVRSLSLVNNAVGSHRGQTPWAGTHAITRLALAQPGSTNRSAMRIQNLDAKCLGKTMYMSH